MQRAVVSGAIILSAAIMAIATPVHADTAFLDRAEIPASVAREVDCGTQPDSIVRQPFAGGFIFRWPCASNHANQIEALVYAADANGVDARLLRFPAPGKPFADNPALEISNVRFSGDREISSLFVDPESRICRSEGLWRLEGAPPAPRLIRRDTESVQEEDVLAV